MLILLLSSLIKSIIDLVHKSLVIAVFLNFWLLFLTFKSNEMLSVESGEWRKQ